MVRTCAYKVARLRSKNVNSCVGYTIRFADGIVVIADRLTV